MYLLFSGVQPVQGPGLALIGGCTITSNTLRRDGTCGDDVYMYLLFSGVQLGPGRAVAGGDHYTKHNALGRDERGRCVLVFCV